MTAEILLAIIGMAVPGILALGGGWVRVARLERDIADIKAEHARSIAEIKAEHARAIAELKAEIEKRVPRELWMVEAEGLRMQLAEIKGMLTPYAARRPSNDDSNPGRGTR
jgi:hypothetical protein